jgi:protein HIRA/HIR1
LTWDSIILYDTYHDHPLSIITGIHYSNLVDAAWTANGRHLCVCSTDGFITFVDFAEGELGRVYVPPPATTPIAAVVKSPQQQQCRVPTAKDEDDESSCQLANLKIHSSSCSSTVPTSATTLPPCEAGWTAVQAPPTKRAKLETSKRGAAVENLDEANGIPKKKQKKRIQPILLAGTSSTATAATTATSAATTATSTGS